jgi:hypothetical protein
MSQGGKYAAHSYLREPRYALLHFLSLVPKKSKDLGVVCGILILFATFDTKIPAFPRASQWYLLGLLSHDFSEHS